MSLDQAPTAMFLVFANCLSEALSNDFNIECFDPFLILSSQTRHELAEIVIQVYKIIEIELYNRIIPAWLRNQ